MYDLFYIQIPSNSNHVSSTLGLKNALQGIDSFLPFACLQDSALSRLWPAFVNNIYYHNHFSCLEKKVWDARPGTTQDGFLEHLRCSARLLELDFTHDTIYHHLFLSCCIHVW